MAQQHINIGTPNNQDGDFVRDAFSKSEDNFTELYALQFYTDRILSAAVAQTGPLTFDVIVNSWIKNGIVYPIVNPFVSDTAVLNAADPTDNRIDVIAVTDSETIVVIEGTPAPNPEEPLVDFDTQLKITSVLVPAGGTPSFTTVVVYDEFVGEPAEFTATESTLGARINLNSTTNPDKNSKHIETTNWLSGDSITFTNDVPLSLVSMSSLRFRIKKKNTAVAQIRVRFYNGNTLISLGNVYIQNGSFGFLGSNVTTYQTILVSPADLNFVGSTFTKIVLTCNNNNGADVRIDDVSLVYGVGTPGGSTGTYINLTDTVDTTFVGKNGFVPVVTTESALTLVDPSTLTAAPQDLQSVLDTGDTATSLDTFSYAKIDLQNAGLGLIDFYKDDGANVWAQMSLINNQAYIGGQGVSNIYSDLAITNGVFNLSQSEATGAIFTNVNFTTPTANTTLSFPAKTVGSYNLATSVNTIEAGTDGNITIDAADIPITDTGGYFTATEVEGALAELVTVLSPFKALNEGSGIGYVIRTSNRAQAGNVGSGALDFGTMYLDATQGATGFQSFTLGEDCKATGFSSIAFGYDVESLDHYSFGSGAINSLQNRFEGAIGTGLIAKDYGTVVVGRANTDYTAGIGLNDANNRCFIVGTGDIAAGVPVTIGTRRDGFIVYNDGRVIAPEFSIAEIDAEATGKALVTKEWLSSKGIVNRVEEDAAVTTTKNIDWGSYETFVYTMTGATTFSDTNLPAAGFSKTITLHMTGNFAPTYPAGWSTYITGTYDGTVLNIIVVEYVASTTPFYKVQITQPD